MSLQTVRQEAASRFQEAQAFLSSVKVAEGQAENPTDLLNIQKGLFIVLLYGAFEYAVTRALIEVTDIINARKVRYDHISEQLYGLALDPQLSSLRDSGRSTKWKCRAELFRVQGCADPVTLIESAFLTEMQNIWAHTIQQTFGIFGISAVSLYDPKVKQYVDEVVDKRNTIAHGRESAATVGQSYTTGDLQRLIDELGKQAQYLFSVFESHISAKSFIKVAYQSHY